MLKQPPIARGIAPEVLETESIPADQGEFEETSLGARDFEAVVRAYRPKVFRYALASLRDVDAAQTIAQDCFYKAFKARESFRGECSLETWLMQIAVNLVRDYARNRRLQFWKSTSQNSASVEVVERYLAGSAPSPEKEVLLRERVQSVWQAVARLPERQKTVFLLRFVEEMELLEIAAATGMKEGTVKIHLFRALRAVRMRVGAAV